MRLLIANHHHPRFWDALIRAVSAAAGARVLLTEDLRDGRVLAGPRLLNPFDLTRAADLGELLAR